MSTQIKADLKQLKGKIKKKWGRLSNDEIDAMKGNWDILVGKLVEHYGMVKDKAQHEVKDFVEAVNENISADDDLAELTEQFHKTAAHLKDNVADVSESIIKYTKNKPIAALAAAFAVGVGLTLLMRK